MYRMTQRWLGLLLPIHERLDAVYSMVLVVPFSCLLLVVILLSRMLMFWITGFLLFHYIVLYGFIKVVLQYTDYLCMCSPVHVLFD